MITTDAVREFQAKERRAKEHLKRRLSCALAEDLNGLLQEELEADVSLYANSGSLRAHKAVLLARAPHLLQGQMHKDPIIIHLPGHELPSLKDFLRQVYTAHERTHSSGINPDAECWVPDSGLSPPDPAGPQSPRDSGAAPEPASGLGADLLDLYQMGEQCDITIQVAEQVFSCHRAILCARSQYFRAMLSGSWMESSRQCITLQGLGPDEMEILLHFIYGAIVDLPPGANSSQVVLAADMLGLDGLKDVVEMVLTRDYCRFFPKPVDGVQRTVLECLSLTHAVGLHNLYALCRRWVADHFVKTWCERNFSLLPLELQRACLTAVTDSMTVRNAVTTLCGSEQLMGSLPEVKWAQQVRSLSAELQEESLRLIVQHLPQVIRTQAFYDLCRREEFTREPALLKKLCSAIREGATVDNCCHLFAAVHRLCGDDAEDPLLDRRALQQEEPFRQEICSLRVRLWTFLLQSFYAVRHTQGWESLSAKHQERILADAIDKGDSRRLGKKPVFSSSQPKTVKCPLAAPESPVVQRTKRHSENTAAAMKSDAPGAASKPGDASKAKNVKKPGERSSAPKAKAAAPVVNGTAAAAATVSGGARREVASANGPRKEHNRKPGNPGARPRTSPPSCTPASATRVHKGALTKGDSTQAQASASSTSGSASPENGACSPRKDSQHSVPGAKPKLQTKLVSKATATKPAQKTEAAKSSSPSSKPNVKEGAKVKAAAAEKMATGARVDARGRGTPEHQVSKQASAARKTASPRKEDSRDGSRTPAAADKAASEPTKKKAVKPSSLSGAAAAAKSSAKPAKASLAASKQSSAAAAKSGAKPKSTSEASLEKAPSKSGAASKAPAATVAPAKRAATREKHSADGKSERGPDGDGAAAPDGGPEAAEHTGPPPEPNPESQAHSQRVSRNAAENGTVPPAGAAEQIIAQPPLDGPPPAVAIASPADTPCSLGSASAEDSWGAGTQQQQQQRRPQRGSPGESESGSTHTTSSDDDIKPRSEDYDAGGSQDDDGSNDRGVSKCGTMRCHDFLGRSSSDTSTPEEFKMYEGSGGGGGGGGGLRVEVRLRGRDAETTSEEEVAAGRGRRPRSWLQRDEAPVEEEQSEVEATVTIRCVPDPQLFSSEEEDEEEDEDATEDERSEVEVIPRQAPPTLPTEPAPHFHGIVNLAFDDDAVDQENEQQQQQQQQQTPDFQSTSNFRRSVLLSVDECEELGSEEGGAQTPPAQGEGSAAAPCDVFESSDCNHPQKQEHKVETEENSVFLTEVQVLAQGQAQPEEWGETTNHVAAEPRDEPPQERPCHLDLRHAERYNGGPCRNHSTKASDCKRVELHLDLAEPPLSADSAAAAALNAAQSPAGNV